MAKKITQTHICTLNVRGLCRSHLDIQNLVVALHCPKPGTLLLKGTSQLTKLNYLRRHWLNYLLRNFKSWPSRNVTGPQSLGAPWSWVWNALTILNLISIIEMNGQ